MGSKRVWIGWTGGSYLGIKLLSFSPLIHINASHVVFNVEWLDPYTSSECLGFFLELPWSSMIHKGSELPNILASQVPLRQHTSNVWMRMEWWNYLTTGELTCCWICVTEIIIPFLATLSEGSDFLPAVDYVGDFDISVIFGPACRATNVVWLGGSTYTQ